MRKSIKRVVSGLTAVATVSSMLLSVSPALASTATAMSDTMSREQISVESTHSVAMTLPAGGILSGNTLIITWTGFSGLWGTPVATCGAGNASATNTAANAVTIQSGADCTGSLTLTGITMTNPGTAGSNSVVFSGTAGISNGFQVPTVDSDQVTVTAQVNATITFDIDTITTAWPNSGESAAPYSVALGTLTTSAVNGSDGTINSIFLDLDTNASGGAVVTVSSTNGALKSLSNPTDTIPSATGQMNAGTAKYGMCLANLSTVSGSATTTAPFTDALCDRTPAGNQVGGFTGSLQSLINTNSLPVSGMRAEYLVDAAIDALVPAHNDYQDILKFIATGTF